MVGMTFRDCTSPQNFEPIACVRSEYAQWLWSNNPDIISTAKPFMPTYTIADPPTDATFTPATADSKNPGVFDSHGHRLPPPFPHHVDDCNYADVMQEFDRTLSCSVMSLYSVLGFPTPITPDTLSHDKLNSHYNHLRDSIGRHHNYRTLEVGLTTIKRQQAVDLLQPWLTKTRYTLLEAASVYGTLADAAIVNRWAWARFFGLRNALASAITARFLQALAIAKRKGWRARYVRHLPRHLMHRAEQLVAKDIANYVWNRNLYMPMTARVSLELKYLYNYLSDFSLPWCKSIGHILP